MIASICNVIKATFQKKYSTITRRGESPDRSNRTVDEGTRTSVDGMSDRATLGGSNEPDFFLGIHAVTNEAETESEEGGVEEDTRSARDGQVVNNILGPPAIKRRRSFGFAKNVLSEKDVKA